MGSLKETVQTAMTTAKGSESIRGNSRSNSQLYNFIARGGEYVLSGDAGEKMWLVQGDADTIPCTLIEKTYAKEVFGAKLPGRKVESYVGTNQEVSYFVTPQGQVFCWPPYSYDGKSYVTNSVTVKNAAGEELGGTDATNPTLNPTLTITFPETGEQVIVENVASGASATVKSLTRGNLATGDVGISYGIGVEVIDSRGVAKGITFENYDNTQM